MKTTEAEVYRLRKALFLLWEQRLPIGHKISDEIFHQLPWLHDEIEALMKMRSEHVSHPMDKNFVQAAAAAVDATLPDNHGFILLIAGFGGCRSFYTSTMERQSAINLLKEFLIKASGSEEWLKHLK